MASSSSKSRGNGWRHAEFQFLDDLDDGIRLKRLLEHRHHLQFVLGADGLDVFKDSRAASAHELHCAAISELAKRDHRFNRVGGFERNIVENECRWSAFDRLPHCRAIRKFDCIDAGAVQNKR